MEGKLAIKIRKETQSMSYINFFDMGLVILEDTIILMFVCQELDPKNISRFKKIKRLVIKVANVSYEITAFDENNKKLGVLIRDFLGNENGNEFFSLMKKNIKEKDFSIALIPLCDPERFIEHAIDAKIQCIDRNFVSLPHAKKTYKKMKSLGSEKHIKTTYRLKTQTWIQQELESKRRSKEKKIA